MAKKTKLNQEITFIDLFSGIGGFHIGLQRASQEFGMEARCLLAVDIDKKARDTYRENFFGTPIQNDVTDEAVKKGIEDLRGKVDIVCAGFPCQPFSVAGKRKGMDDDRGTLFKHILDIVVRCKPKAIFLENVRNLERLRNTDGSLAIDVIRNAMAGAGYPLKTGVLKASSFGLPTNRPRLYLVGFRKDISDTEKFEYPVGPTEPMTLRNFFPALGNEWNGMVSRRGWPNIIGNTLRVGGIGSGFRGKKRDKRNWDSYKFFEGQKQEKIHLISAAEARAMMGFPADFRSPGNLSERQQKKQLGNSVAIPVIQAIAVKIIQKINGR